MGDFDDLLDAGNFIRTLENRQKYFIACPEEIAYKNNLISKKKLISLLDSLGNNNYKKYLKGLIS